MSMPRFTAEASLYKATEGYSMALSGNSTTSRTVIPASRAAACIGYCDKKYPGLAKTIEWTTCWWLCMQLGGPPPIIVGTPTGPQPL